MTEGTSLINLGDISKPATVLIEKISEAIGGYFKPYQIRRVAKAEADAQILEAQSQIEITDLQRRALVRFVGEEAKKQDNMEKIIQKALPHLSESSKPDNIEDDWIANFFDKCRLVSDEEMQSLWAKVLGGEASSPGAYSKRTVNMLGSLDKADASLFTSLCGFCWHLGDAVPLIFNEQETIYNDQGINFNALTHLDSIGLVNFGAVTSFSRLKLPKRLTVIYHGIVLILEFKQEKDNSLDIGKVLLTSSGQELAAICGSKAVEGFQSYIIQRWVSKGITVSSPHPKTALNTEQLIPPDR
jgi:hypothetical protein